MRVCLLCAEAMPDPVRDDALYCSASCKLKAQRKRKKERPQVTTKEPSCSVDRVVPLGEGPQLWLPFMGRGIGDGRQLSFGFVQVGHDGSKQRSAPSGKDASAARAATADRYGRLPSYIGTTSSLAVKLDEMLENPPDAIAEYGAGFV